MKHYYRRKMASIIFFSFVFSLYTSFLSAIGFGAGTPVHTPSGTIPIEQLQCGDSVWSYDTKTNRYVEKQIIGILEKTAPSLIAFTTQDNEIITVEKDQTFYSAVDDDWVSIQSFLETSTPLFHSPLEESPLTSIFEIKESKKVYDLSVADMHTFFVGQRPILARNFIVEFVLRFVIDNGIKFAGASIGTALFGAAAFGFSVMNDKDKLRTKANIEYNGIGTEIALTGGPSPDPEDDPNKKERKINDLHKSEVFGKKEIKNNYRFNKQDKAYVLQNKAKGLLDGLVHYLTWDHLHKELEAFDKALRHLGALDPKTLKLIPGSQDLVRKLR